MQKLNLHFLPGFLGLPAQWELLKEEFKPHTCFFHSINDPVQENDSAEPSFSQWATQFNHSINTNSPLTQAGRGPLNVLIGYSLGGRLALHALLNAPQIWHAAIIISAHPGLLTAEEKQTRLENDEAWALRFLHEDWATLMQAWDNQGVFSGQKNLCEKKEINFNRLNLANNLRNFSLGRQRNLRDKIQQMQIPILWLSGELDVKFSHLASEMATLNPNITYFNFKGIGHRVPWENTTEFILQCQKFLKSINLKY